MKKGYSDKQLKTNSDTQEQQYFFPKENPPITILATSQEEAVEKLQAIKNKTIQ